MVFQQIKEVRYAKGVPDLFCLETPHIAVIEVRVMLCLGITTPNGQDGFISLYSEAVRMIVI